MPVVHPFNLGPELRVYLLPVLIHDKTELKSPQHLFQQPPFVRVVAYGILNKVVQFYVSVVGYIGEGRKDLSEGQHSNG